MLPKGVEVIYISMDGAVQIYRLMEHSKHRIPTNIDIDRNCHRFHFVGGICFLEIIPFLCAASNGFHNHADFVDHQSKARYGSGISVIIVAEIFIEIFIAILVAIIIISDCKVLQKLLYY